MAKEDVKERDEDTEDSADEGDDEVDAKPSVTEENGETKVRIPEDKKTRKQRREEEGRGKQSPVNEIKAMREQLEQERRRGTEMQERLLRTIESRQQPQGGGQGDPYKAELSNIRQEQETLTYMLRSGGVTSEAEAKRLRDRYYELEDRRDTIKEERLERRVSSKIPAPQQQGTGEEAILRAEFPDVAAHPGAAAWAGGKWKQLLSEGKPANLETARQAMREARENPYFGFARTAPRPSEAQQARYGAVPAQAGARASANEMTLTKDQKRLAVAAYPQLAAEDEHKAYAAWAKKRMQWEKDNPL